MFGNSVSRTTLAQILESVKDIYLPPMPGHEMAIIDNLEDNIASSQAEHLPDSFGR